MSAKSIFKPALASVVMGAAVEGVLHVTGHMGAWAVLFSIIVAVPVYAVGLTAIGGLTKEDLESIPYVGRRMLRIGQKLGCFR